MRSLLLIALTLALPAASAAGAAPAACAMAPREQALAKLLTAKPAQLRPTLTCDPQLVALARERAADMALRHYFGHANPDGVGPNDFLRARGFALPPSYPSGRSNTVEAIAGGYDDAAEVWAELLGSALHSEHMRGADPTFVEQDRFGIGYVRAWNTPQVDFWVLLIARHPVSGEESFGCSPPPSECVTRLKATLVLDPDQNKLTLKTRIKQLPPLETGNHVHR